MRRMVCVALLLVAVGAAWAEEEELHLLWGIEFGQDVETLQRILKEDSGVEMEYQSFGASYSGEQYEKLICINTEEITILGYPVEEFVWHVIPTERIIMSFSYYIDNSIEDPVGAEEAMAPLKDILRALTEKFGAVNSATYEIFSAGYSAWAYSKDEDSIHEVGHFEDSDIEELNLQLLLGTRDYITDRSTISIVLYIGNICVSWVHNYAAYSDNYHINLYVEYRDEAYEDTKEDVYEEFIFEDPVKYEDRGF